MVNLAQYAHLKICVAVSGGRDSMALLHYMHAHADEYGITLSALNCDHKIRGKASADDSAFVGKFCAALEIPLMFFEWECGGIKTEESARQWRLSCYAKAIESGADRVATAHHANDNAETVIFNLARGSALSGLTGITDSSTLIRPLINCTRAQINEYVVQNGVPYVDDGTNFTDNYTRNKIRHNVLPQLENAVPSAVKSICRFAGLAADDEKYFDRLIAERRLLKVTPYGIELAYCEEKVIFRRAAAKAVREQLGKKDYTHSHIENLYALQFSRNGKKFGFLNLTAYKEEGKIVITVDKPYCDKECAFCSFEGENFAGSKFIIKTDRLPSGVGEKALAFDKAKIPPDAVIRFMRRGDEFTKFGGGTKKLGDYFTDKKIPARLRGSVPLIADGSKILVVGGVEISDGVKITERTEKINYLICADYSAIK